MTKACQHMSIILCMLSGIASAATTPATVFPIRSLVGDDELGRSLRAFEDEQSQQLLFVSLVQVGEPQLSFDKDQYEWVSNAMATLVSNINPQVLDIYTRAATGAFHLPIPYYNPVASSQALQEEIWRQNMRLDKMGRCLSKPTKPWDSMEPRSLRRSQQRRSDAPVDNIDPQPTPIPGIDPDTGSTVITPPPSPVTDEPCMDIQSPSIQKDDWIQPAQDINAIGMGDGAKPDPMLWCQPPAYVSEINSTMRQPNLERLYTDVCRRGLLSSRQSPGALDAFTGFILDLVYLPQRIMRFPTFTARFRLATVPSAEARTLVNRLVLPHPWAWARLARVEPRIINRPTTLMIDQLAYFHAWMHETDLHVEVRYSYFGTSALRSKYSTPLQYVPVDVSAWTPGDSWNLDSLGLSLRFTLAADSFN